MAQEYKRKHSQEASSNSDSSDSVIEIVQNYLKTQGFTDRKLTDTPTDALQVVNRKYVTNNGTFANRPHGAVTGQLYLATDLAGNGLPAWYNGNSSVWGSATGSVLGKGL